MTTVTIKYKTTKKKRDTPTVSKDLPSRTARMLALAYYVETQIDNGAIRDFAEAARLLGVTRARMTQVMKLLYLSPTIQASILCGELIVNERRLRVTLKYLVWKEQDFDISQSFLH